MNNNDNYIFEKYFLFKWNVHHDFTVLLMEWQKGFKKKMIFYNSNSSSPAS